MKTQLTVLAGVAVAILGALGSQAEAGALPPRVWSGETVEAHGKAFDVVTFRGGELAEVALLGDGDTDLDLFVLDSYGNVVASDEGYTDGAFVTWYPLYTQQYTIVVVNHGSIYNRFDMATN
jgi:hypothetical protein